MSPLLQKIVRRPHLRIRRGPRPANRRDLGWHWVFVTFGLVMVLAAYFWYVSARLILEPVQLNIGPSDPAFSAALGPLLGADFTGGNELELLQNGDAFFPEMLRAIHDARRTITLETYIWSSGVVSDRFIAALTERAHHGVKVDVLVDGLGALHFKREDRERLARGGVELVTFGREHWWQIKPNLNHRTHRKILVVDGRIGFTGGMCVDDHWRGNATAHDRWRDTEVRLQGPAVRQLQAVFASNWLQTTGKLLFGPGYFPEYGHPGDTVAQCFKSGPGDGAQAARTSYLVAIASARRTIDIEHAYFVPDDLAIRTLLEARRRGVRIRVIVPARNDSRFGRAASRSRWGELLAAGVEFYRYEPAMLHAKTMSVDDTFVTIGSVNFDNRSFSINDEVALNAIDRDFAEDHLRMFDRDLDQSTPYTLAEYESRPLYIKLVDKFCGLFRSQL